MSSHHIVREKQEPALLIIDPTGFDPENLGQLLEWSPTVLVSDDAVDYVESLGIKIDFMITGKEMALQPATRLIPTESDVLGDGLKYLVGEQYPSVNIIDTSFKLKDYALYADKINLVIYTPKLKIFPVTSGFSKWKQSGETIHLLSEISELKSTGLKPVNESIFETEKDGFYSLVFNQILAFIAEEI
ncbi:thiamine pyrophosphokinase [Pedobacter sp. HMF7647]|uniref:Thiamine pyrophosphokinase n=1 Tax=Hufsiella arboris TaxID=2695275 RepID=A0A7K1Y664_9SPHI|nr:thiamine pyrophosphokinase [Hufsiella arboris]MXV49901.1 thiamine pyrophosphokinase [Hufsiella arboris]